MLPHKQQSGYPYDKAQYKDDVSIHNSSPGKLIQPGQMAGQQGKATGQDQRAKHHQEHAARHLQCMEMLAEAAIKIKKAVNEQRREQERHGQAQGVNPQEKYAL